MSLRSTFLVGLEAVVAIVACAIALYGLASAFGWTR